MGARVIKTVGVMGLVLVGCFIGGCESGAGPLGPRRDLGATIGSLAEVVTPDKVAVEGYCIVGGLRGAGSGDCPPRVRAYLKQYILKQLSDSIRNADSFISSNDTAVVRVYGVMSTAVSEGRDFDVMIATLPGTQTRSLEGGWLYRTELKQLGRFGLASRILAVADGPVFMDTLDGSGIDRRAGYGLGRGRVLGEYPLGLILRRPDFRVASAIRNRLNERFGPATARAISAGQIELNVPGRYGKRQEQFILVAKAMYLAETEEITKERVKAFVGKLAVAEDKDASEIALEAIGNESLKKLPGLLKSGYEEVRLRAARCMLNLGSDAGLETLREIAMDKGSAYRVEALEAITISARRNDAAAVSRILLRDEDFAIRLAAYEQLRKLDDIAVTRRAIARSFYLERVAQTKYKSIYVSRSGQPRIVLFGAPIICSDNMFVQSANGEITIDSRAGQDYVSVMRKHPTRPTVIGPLRSSAELGDIIETVCEEPVRRTDGGRIGLGVTYADMIALLKQMCEKGAVGAEFLAGPLPRIE